MLSGSVADNYFMWVLFYLPLLRLIEEASERDASTELTILLGANHTTFQKESLKSLGYSNFRVLNGKKLKPDRLFIPSFQYLDLEQTPIGHINILSKRSIEWLNQRLFQPDGLPVKLFISRSDALTRRILNQEDVEEALPDFQCHSLSGMTFLEQVRLFNRVEVVIAPHGAGLTNLVFARKTKVFEFYPNNREMNNPKNLQICEYLGHEYHLLVIRSENENQDMFIDDGAINYIKSNI